MAAVTAYGADDANSHKRSKPVVGSAIRFDVSPPLWMIKNPAPVAARPRQIPIQKLDLKKRAHPAALSRDPLVGRRAPLPFLGPMPNPIITFEGTSDADNQAVVGGRVVPPDTNGDVGINHYVQWNNLVFEVFDKSTGSPVLGPLAGNSLFTGFGGPCEANNDGDPLAVYDRFADRWILSQFSIFDGIQCVAVSQTGDPTGAYFRYAFLVTPGAENDYPKMGVWPTVTNSSYIFTFRHFGGTGFTITATALERDQMIAGNPAAQFVNFDLNPGNPGCNNGALECYEGVAPVHSIGETPPPDGPGYLVMSYDDEAFGGTIDGTQDFYKLWKIAPDWATPANSTLTGPTNIATPEMDINLCGFNSCVPQQGSGEVLDTLAQFTMNRATYRNFGDHEAIFVNNTVNIGSNVSGIRWAELRDPNGAPSLFQTGTHGPADGLHRWMGSLAVDVNGNMALGYSTSGTSLFPSIRYAGRLAGDPVGTLPQTENELFAGTGSQTGSFSRWGDYSAMSVDPTDDCTFWYTTEYYQTTGAFDFHTRIGSFKFPSCIIGPHGTVSGTVTNANTSAPIAGVSIHVGVYGTNTDGSGAYSINVPPNTYDINASAYGFAPQTVTGVAVADGANVTQNFALVPLPQVQVSGTVTDGSGAGFALYAKVKITPSSGPVTTVYTNPTNGGYSLPLFANSSYTFDVSAMTNGYVAQSRPVSVGATNQTEDFALLVDQNSCNAPGYGFSATSLVNENFDAGIPGTWTVVNNTTTCPGAGAGVWNTIDPEGLGNLTGGSGLHAEINSDACTPSASVDSDLVSPVLDLSGVSGSQRLLISFNSDYRDLCFGSNAVSLDVWDGASWATVYDFCGADRRGPRLESFSTQAANGVANSQVRFHYVSDWDWWWQVDNASLAVGTCTFGGGGLILGNVSDANTSTALNGAGVSLDSGQSTTTAATPADPTIGDGFYLLYAPPGGRTLTVSKTHYATQNINLTVAGGSVQRQDVQLAAGKLASTPSELRKRLKIGGSASLNLTLNNSGGAPAAFNIVEIDAPSAGPRPAKPYKAPKLPFDPKTKLGYLASVARNSQGLKQTLTKVDPMKLPIVPKAGEAVFEFNTNLAFPWGDGFNTSAVDLWVSNLLAGSPSADDKNHRFTTAGVDTGDTIDFSVFGAVFAADMTYNQRTGMLWQVAVGGDNCLYELDPVAKVATGTKICPNFGTSMRGIAYNPAADTYFVGTWNGTFVTEVDGSGAILRSKNVGLSISGLAYNGRTGHLFVQVNDAAQLIWVLDANNNFNIVSAFVLAGSGGPAYGAFEGAGLEMDCSGNLWSVNQITKKVFVNKSGETNTCVTNIAWLTETPSSGSVAAAGSSNVNVTFNAATQPTGCYESQLVVNNDTPYGATGVATGLTVAFKDVLPATKGDKYIHAIAGANITHGCGQGRFCPAVPATRGAVAVWLLRSQFGIGYAPPPAVGIFVDVSPESFGADYIEDAYNRGIFAKCNLNGALRFCPNQPVQRRGLATYFLKTSQGPSYVPPACTGIFRDVKCTDAYAPWIEDAYNRGWMDACLVKPTMKLFCPTRVEQRGTTAQEDAKTFGIPACKQ